VYFHSPVTGWSAAIGLPVAAVDAPIRRSYFVLVGLVLGGILVGMVCAVLVGRAITLPMQELKTAAEALGHGQAPTVHDTRLPEIRQVASALAKAHEERESLLRIERDARTREHEARMLAERANRMKDEFLAMLGHELRNPLAAISTASLVLEAATGSKPNPKAAQSAMGIIRRQSAHLSRLTDDLLDAGRVVLGRIQLQRQPVDLAAAVERNLETLRSGNQFADHTLTVSTVAASVDADPTRLDQIITNLLTNAVKYTPAGGHIDVRVEQDGGHAVLKVRDTGIGIEPELMPRIFDLFVQGARAPDRALGGLGIGLTLVQRLTELHGGEVKAASGGSGQGTTGFHRELLVWFRLRARQTTAPETVPSKEKEVWATGRSSWWS
jgi:signal transduction histidine kinase